MRGGMGDQVIKSIQRLAGPFSQVEPIVVSGGGSWGWVLKARLAESGRPKFGARLST